MIVELILDVILCDLSMYIYIISYLVLRGEPKSQKPLKTQGKLLFLKTTYSVFNDHLFSVKQIKNHLFSAKNHLFTNEWLSGNIVICERQIYKPDKQNMI